MNVALFAVVLLNCAADVEGPLTTFHAPVPMPGTLAASVTLLVVVQMVWSGPAFDVVGEGATTMLTSSCVEAHGAFTVVQRKV